MWEHAWECVCACVCVQAELTCFILSTEEMSQHEALRLFRKYSGNKLLNICVIYLLSSTDPFYKSTVSPFLGSESPENKICQYLRLNSKQHIMICKPTFYCVLPQLSLLCSLLQSYQKCSQCSPVIGWDH